MNYISYNSPDFLLPSTPLRQPTGTTGYGAIEQPQPHVAVQINDAATQQLETVGRYAYHALQGGIVGAVVSGTIGLACTYLASQTGTDDTSVAMSSVAMMLLGTAGGAVMRVKQMRDSDRNIHTLHSQIQAYRDTKCAGWQNEPGYADFQTWFDGMVNAHASLEFARRPEHVVEKLTDILDAAASNAVLRERIFEIAADNVANCHDRIAFGMTKMLNEIRDTEMLERGDDTKAFLDRGKVAHYNAVLEQVAHYIADNPGPGPISSNRPESFSSESLELYAYYAKKLEKDFKFTDTVRHNRFAAQYGATSGYTVDEVRKMVNERADQPKALQTFLKTDWPSWARHLEQAKQPWFEKIDDMMEKRMDAITSAFNKRHAGPSSAPEQDRIVKDMHLELAATDRKESRQKLVDALTDHYFDTNELDSFGFDTWLVNREAEYKKTEQAFINNPHDFANLFMSSAGKLIGRN